MSVFKIELISGEIQTINKLIHNANDLYWAGSKKNNRKEINKIVEKIRNNSKLIKSYKLNSFFENLSNETKNEQGPGLI